MSGSAPRWTMRSAKPSTRRPSCSASAIPAARKSRSMPRVAAQPSSCRARCSGGRSRISRSPDSRPRSGTRRWRARRLSDQDDRRSLRELPGSGRRHRQRPHRARHRASMTSVSVQMRNGAGRRRRRRRQSAARGGARESRRRAWLPPHRAAARALHRQCRHDRLGGSGAARPRPDRRPCRAGPRPLAARSRRAAGARCRGQGLSKVWISAHAAMTARLAFLYDRRRHSMAAGHGACNRSALSARAPGARRLP